MQIDGVEVSLAAHPRLLLNAVIRDSVRQRAAGHDAVFIEQLRTRAEQFLRQPIASYHVEGRRLLAVSRRMLEEVLALSLLAVVTDEDQFIDAATKRMIAAADFPDWNPSHFLDTAEISTALAIGYDWLHDHLSFEHRRRIEAALIDKALKPSLLVDEGWVTCETNWNPVCHAGMTLAALAVADIEPEISSRVIERATQNIATVASAYFPDGAYDEGPSYWMYGTTYLVLFWAALETATNSTAGPDVPGVLASANYMKHIVAPSGTFYNYSDGRTQRPFIPALLWLARKLHRPALATIDRELMKTGRIFGEPCEEERLFPLAILWNAMEDAAADEASEQRIFVGGGRTPIALIRSQWGDANATFLGIKGGSPWTSHAHMDAGSFVLESDGIRWAIDLPMENYHAIESAGLNLWDRSQQSDRWRVLRNSADGHGILRFNNGSQSVGGFAMLRAVAVPNVIGSVEIDLSSIYPAVTKSVRRTAALNHDHSIVLRDTWIAGDEPLKICWQMLTPAEVKIVKNEFVLRHGEKKLRITLDGNIDSTSVLNLDTLAQPYDSPNPGISRLNVYLTTPPNGEGGLTVRFGRE